jgi:hypothetical protein
MCGVDFGDEALRNHRQANLVHAAAGVDRSTSLTSRNTRPNDPHAPSPTPCPSIEPHSSHHGFYEALNKSSNSRNPHIITPPPCQAERYSRRTRTSPRRPMSPFQRRRSWAQYVRCSVKLTGANTRNTEQPASRYRPAACPRKEDPSGTQAPNIHMYNRMLTPSRPQISRRRPGSSSPLSQ